MTACGATRWPDGDRGIRVGGRGSHIAEETGVAVRTTAVAGAYSDPEHLLAYPDGGIYQQPAIQKVPGQPGERYAQGQAIMLG